LIGSAIFVQLTAESLYTSECALKRDYTTRPFYSPFFRDHPGEPVPEEEETWHRLTWVVPEEEIFWAFMVQRKITEMGTPTIRLTCDFKKINRCD